MYIYHKQCEIMQKIQWNSSKANFTDFPLTDGAAVEQQCLCKWLQEIDSKGKWILVHQPARKLRFLKVLSQFKAYQMIYKRGKGGLKPQNRPCLEILFKNLTWDDGSKTWFSRLWHMWLTHRNNWNNRTNAKSARKQLSKLQKKWQYLGKIYVQGNFTHIWT